jgi:hypothetical protein
MRKFAQTGIIVFLLSLSLGASAFTDRLWLGGPATDNAKIALLESFKIMLGAGAQGNGTDGLARILVRDFTGDLNIHTNQEARCTFESVGAKGLQSFAIVGDNCKKLVDKFRIAGFGKPEDGFVIISYLACMISVEKGNEGLVSCEASKRLF